MQEVFEKIIERLEEERKKYNGCQPSGVYMLEANRKSIEIVKQAAAEYKENDAFNRVYEKVVAIEREYAKNGDIENVNRCIKLENLMQYFKEELKGCNNGYNNGWIPCSERLPENEEEVEITFTRQYYKTGEILYLTARAFYEDGTLTTEDSGYCWDETDNWEYCKEKDAYIIPEGWYEGVSFTEEFGIVDMPVIAWRYPAEPYQPKGE